MLRELLIPIDDAIDINSLPVSDYLYGHIIGKYQSFGHLPDIDKYDLALIGVKEERGAYHNEGCMLAPDEIRKYFYRLYTENNRVKVIDLGNLKTGHSLHDTYAALATAIEELLKEKVIPIIIGGSHDLTYGQYLGYREHPGTITLAVVDEEINMKEFDKKFDAQSFLLKIFMEHPGRMANYTHIGYQNYLSDPKALDTIDQLNFETFRLSYFQDMMTEVEPLVRDADLLSFDISAIRQSDAVGNNNASPNGFYGEDACRIMRYAGLSDKLSSVGIYETNPVLDINGQTCFLVAQMIWHFIDGYYLRKNEAPYTDKQNYLRYIVELEEEGYKIVFRKSKKTGRWWMEVPIRKKHKKSMVLISCSYEDYKSACDNEIPERWLKAYGRLN